MEIEPAAANLSVAASQDRALVYSLERGSGEWVKAKYKLPWMIFEYRLEVLIMVRNNNNKYFTFKKKRY